MTRTNRRLTLGALPLIAYPVLAAFSLVAFSSSPSRLSLRLVGAYCFHAGIIVYPLVYFGSLVTAVSRRKTNEESALRASGWPLRFLVCLAFLFIAEGAIEILER